MSLSRIENQICLSVGIFPVKSSTAKRVMSSNIVVFILSDRVLIFGSFYRMTLVLRLRVGYLGVWTGPVGLSEHPRVISGQAQWSSPFLTSIFAFFLALESSAPETWQNEHLSPRIRKAATMVVYNSTFSILEVPATYIVCCSVRPRCHFPRAPFGGRAVHVLAARAGWFQLLPQLESRSDIGLHVLEARGIDMGFLQAQSGSEQKNVTRYREGLVSRAVFLLLKSDNVEL